MARRDHFSTRPPTRLDNLMFLLATSPLMLACPGDDGSSEGSAGSSSTGGVDPTTGGTPPGSTGAVDSTGAMTSIGESSTGEASTGGTTGDPTTSTSSTGMTSDGTDSGSSGDSGDSGTTGGASAAEVCAEAGIVFGGCYGMPPAYFETICYDAYAGYVADGMIACAEAFIDLFACANALDCVTIMMGPDVACPAESMAVNTACGL